METISSLSTTKYLKIGKGFCNPRRQNPQPFNQTMIHFLYIDGKIEKRCVKIEIFFHFFSFFPLVIHIIFLGTV